ncbi:Cytochrome P450 monooxygenase FUM15 [Bienertia sinuspersici]
MGDDGTPTEALLPSHQNTRKSFNRLLSHAQDELHSFRSYLRYMCVDQSTIYTAILSWTVFFIFAIAVPAFSHFFLACPSCDSKHARPYDVVVQLSLSSIATLSFLCITHFVRKYGLRRFLFFDKLVKESDSVRHHYTTQLHRSLKILSVFVLPCFVAECAYKIWWYSSGGTQVPFLGSIILSDIVACSLELISWLYRTLVFFLVCVLFRLICYLQILRLKDFATVFELESDVASVLVEHLRIRRHLRIISHRYRKFILWSLIIITSSQLAALLLTTKNHSHISIFRAGELALCSMTLMTGLAIILRSATKITHKAQAITSLSAKWHACATVESFVNTSENETPSTNHTGATGFFDARTGDSDEEEAGSEEDDVNNTKFLPAYAYSSICFQKRQALVTYFENNKAGITVYGFMLDRTWLQLIFGIELSLVLWLLGKTVGF